MVGERRGKWPGVTEHLEDDEEDEEARRCPAQVRVLLVPQLGHTSGLPCFHRAQGLWMAEQ